MGEGDEISPSFTNYTTYYNLLSSEEMLLRGSESITMVIATLILRQIQVDKQKKIFQINLLVLLVDLITKISRFENSLFSQRHLFQFGIIKLQKKKINSRVPFK